jgi:pimeloyl-ACP methyl ester carboxylesterase
MLNARSVGILFTLLMVATSSRLCAGAALGQPKDVSFKADVDGTEQFYMEMLPADFRKRNTYDLILGLHGHGSGRKQFAMDGRPECSSFRAFAAKHGMIAVTPDYRATTSWMGPKAEADMVQIIGDLKKKYKINRVFIVGASMGGTSVLTFAALHPDMVDGVTSMNGHANHVEYNQFQDAIADSFGGSKSKMRKEYKKRSAEFYAHKLTMPIAFTVSDNDTVVPPASTLRLAKALKKLKRKILVIDRPNGGHRTSYEDATEAMEFMLSSSSKASTRRQGKTDPSEAEDDISEAKPDQPGAEVEPVKTDPDSEERAIVMDSAAQTGKTGLFFADAKPDTIDANGKAELGLKFYVEKTGNVSRGL